MWQKLAATILTVAILWGLRTLIISLLLRRIEDPLHRYNWRKGIDYTAIVIGILVVGRIWSEAFGSISTFLGLVSAGIAIALKDPLINIAGWAYILWLRPIKVGDRIEIGDRRGDVIDQGLFQFSLMEIGHPDEGQSPTGRIIYVPNGLIFSQTLANFSHGFPYIWNEVPVLITFESNWKSAKTILTNIGKQHGEELSKQAERELKKTAVKFMIYDPKFAPQIITNTQASGVLLTMRYICKPREKRATEHAIWEDILTEFAKHDDIALAYPTTRIYREPEEGPAASKSNDPQPTMPRAHG